MESKTSSSESKTSSLESKTSSLKSKTPWSTSSEKSCMSARPYINMHTYDDYLKNATDFDARGARETTAVPSIVILYPEVWYGLVCPINVCQRCFVLGRLCFNFTARVAGGNRSTGHRCDQCRMGHIAGCSTNDYTTKRGIPRVHQWVINHSSVNTEMFYPSIWYYRRVIQARRTGEGTGRGYSDYALVYWH
ncbi:hypothetical protein INT45_012674 [Circinella minor]|uniref:Uncharacterized protein n=1 Tax=Circinella minor TaxID=1195481 RepID=A0A8H7R949_9FUNG|nr:hypothetical protein INT45_012674 [Circinella minor]